MWVLEVVFLEFRLPFCSQRHNLHWLILLEKIKVVQAVADALALDNVNAYHKRAEDVNDTFDFVVSRAVTRMERFVPWVQHKIKVKSKHALSNGILYLKGGDLKEELSPYPKAKTYDLSMCFKEDFFETKKVVHLPL